MNLLFILLEILILNIHRNVPQVYEDNRTEWSAAETQTSRVKRITMTTMIMEMWITWTLVKL